MFDGDFNVLGSKRAKINSFEHHRLFRRLHHPCLSHRISYSLEAARNICATRAVTKPTAKAFRAAASRHVLVNLHCGMRPPDNARKTTDLAAWFSFQRAGWDLTILRYCRPNVFPFVL